MFIFLFQAGNSCKWTDDSQWLILESFDIIQNSPSHTYHSALPFSPSSSWLREYYSAEFPQKVKVVMGLPTGWGACYCTVSFDHPPQTLACQNNIVAVGLQSSDIIILDAITGTHTSVLSGHTDSVGSLTFSMDGIFLVSGSDDKTIKLWDIQTGGVIKTFCGHTDWVQSVHISPDCMTIASGSDDRTIRIWDLWTGECPHIIGEHDSAVTSVSFSPTNSQLLISASGSTVQQWDVNGCKIGPAYPGDGVAFSLDGSCFISWQGEVATIQNSDSRAIVTSLLVTEGTFQCCCFSPDGRFAAGAADEIIYVWDITSSDPCLVETFVGHTGDIISLTFSPSSLISASWDQSVKFWQVGALSTNLVDPKSTPPTSVSIQSINLQADHGIAISSDSDGVVRIWDISMGLCKASFQTPVKDQAQRDAQMTDGKLILVWLADKNIYIWDIKKGKLLQIVDISSGHWFGDLRISGDGSMVFFRSGKSIQAWSIWTGEAVGEVRLEHEPDLGSLTMDGSRVWVHFRDLPTQGWDFGIPGSPPILLPNTFSNRPHLDFIDGTKHWNTGPSRIEDTVTGKEVLRLPGRFAMPSDAQWDGQYLVTGYNSGEVLIVDFNHTIPT
jgi:WD40 repeat protein